MAAAIVAIGAHALAAAPAETPPLAYVPELRLADLPNVTVTYYDVAGKDIAEIHRSLARSAYRDPATQKRIPATSSWSIAAAVKWSKTGAQCSITDVTLRFTATATMPRLLAPPETPELVLATWNNYAARLEERQAEQLRFAYDRRASVEQAIRNSDCDKWESVAGAEIGRLREQQLLAFKKDPRAMPKLEVPTRKEDERKPTPDLNTELTQ